MTTRNAEVDASLRLANTIGPMVLAASDYAALNALVATVALYCCEPDLDKENAKSMAIQFGEAVATHIERTFDSLVSSRLKFEMQAPHDHDFDEIDMTGEED